MVQCVATLLKICFATSALESRLHEVTRCGAAVRGLQSHRHMREEHATGTVVSVVKKKRVSVTETTRVKKNIFFLQYFYTTALFIKISIELVIFLSHL